MLPLLRISKRFVALGCQRRNIFSKCPVRLSKLSLSLNGIVSQNTRNLQTSFQLLNNPKRFDSLPDRGIPYANVLDEILFKMDSDVRKQGRISLYQVKEVLNYIKKIGIVTNNQALLIIRCCGSLLPEIMVEERNQLAEEIWTTINELGCPMDVSLYNTLLTIYLENEHPFDPVEFLSMLDQNNITPNRVTYQRLIQRYCQEGNIDGASNILEFMKEKQLPLNETIFNDLIIGHSKSNNMDDAKNILELMRKSQLIPASKTYCALARGYSMNGDIDSVLSTLQEAEENDAALLDREILSIIYTLTINNYGDYIAQILPKMEKRFGFNHDCLNTILDLVNKGHHKVGYTLLNTMNKGNMPDGTPAPSGVFFIKQLVRRDMPPELILDYCNKLQESGLNDGALLKALECALSNSKTDHFIFFLKGLHNQKHFIRPHFFWPLLITKKEQSDTEKFDILKLMIETNCSADLTTFTDYVLPYINLDDPISVVKKLKADGHDLNIVVNAMIWHFLYNKDVKTACNLLDKFPGIRTDPDMTDTLKFLATSYLDKDRRDAALTIKILEHAHNHPATVDVYTNQQRDPYGKFLMEYLKYADVSADELTPILLAMKDKAYFVTRFHGNTILALVEGKKDKLNEEFEELLHSVIPEYVYNETTAERIEFGQRTWEMDIENLKSSLKDLQPGNPNRREILKRLFMVYSKELKIKDVEYILGELKQEGFTLTATYMAMLVNVYSCHSNLAEASHYKKQLDNDYPEFKLDNYKVLNLAAALAREKKFDEVEKLLNENLHQIKSTENFTKYMENAVQRLLSSLAQTGQPEMVHKFLDFLIKAGCCKPTARFLGSLVTSHLYKSDLKGAIEELKRISDEHKCTPASKQICKQLIELEDTDKLQNVMEIVSKCHGENNAMIDLACCFVEVGRVKQARKIFATPGLRAFPDRMLVICESFLKIDKIEALENFVEVTKDLFGINREQMLSFLIEGYVKTENVEKALSAYIQMQEENVRPSDSTLYLLGTFLTRMNRTPPFTVPEKPQEDKRNQMARKNTNLTNAKQEENVPIENQSYHDFRQAFDEGNWTGAVEQVLNWNDRLLMRNRKDVVILAYRLAELGDVDTIRQIQDKIKPGMKIHLTNQLGEAYIKCGRGKDFLTSLQTETSKYEEYFPENALMLLIDTYPEDIGQISQIAEKIYTEKHLAKIRNTVWAYYMKNKKFDKADAIMQLTPELKTHITLRPLTRFSREFNDEIVSEKVFEVVKETQMDNRGKGIAASDHLNVLVTNKKLDEAVEFFRGVLKSLEPKHINRTTVLRLGEMLLAAGKCVPFVENMVKNIPEDTRNSSENER